MRGKIDREAIPITKVNLSIGDSRSAVSLLVKFLTDGETTFPRTFFAMNSAESKTTSNRESIPDGIVMSSVDIAASL